MIYFIALRVFSSTRVAEMDRAVISDPAMLTPYNGYTFRPSASVPCKSTDIGYF